MIHSHTTASSAHTDHYSDKNQEQQEASHSNQDVVPPEQSGALIVGHWLVCLEGSSGFQNKAVIPDHQIATHVLMTRYSFIGIDG